MSNSKKKKVLEFPSPDNFSLKNSSYRNDLDNFHNRDFSKINELNSQHRQHVEKAKKTVRFDMSKTKEKEKVNELKPPNDEKISEFQTSESESEEYEDEKINIKMKNNSDGELNITLGDKKSNEITSSESIIDDELINNPEGSIINDEDSASYESISDESAKSSEDSVSDESAKSSEDSVSDESAKSSEDSVSEESVNDAENNTVIDEDSESSLKRCMSDEIISNKNSTEIDNHIDEGNDIQNDIVLKNIPIDPPIKSGDLPDNIYNIFPFLANVNPQTFTIAHLPTHNETKRGTSIPIWKSLSKSSSSSIYYDDEKDVIIKIFTTNIEFKKEVFFLNKLKQYGFVPNIIAMEKSKYIIIMTYCGDKLTKRNKPQNCHEQIAHIERVLALECVFHNDLETRNFVIDKNGKISIIDFAMSTLMHSNKPDRNDFKVIYNALECNPLIKVDIRKLHEMKETAKQEKQEKSRARRHAIRDANESLRSRNTVIGSGIAKKYVNPNSSLHVASKQFIGPKPQRQTFKKPLQKQKEEKQPSKIQQNKLNSFSALKEQAERRKRELKQSISKNASKTTGSTTTGEVVIGNTKDTKIIFGIPEKELMQPIKKKAIPQKSKFKSRGTTTKPLSKNTFNKKIIKKNPPPVTKLKPKKEITSDNASTFTFLSTPTLVREIRYINKLQTHGIVPRFIKCSLPNKTIYVEKLIPLGKHNLPENFNEQLTKILDTLLRYRIFHNSISVNKLFLTEDDRIVIVGFSEATKDNRSKDSPDSSRIYTIITAFNVLLKRMETVIEDKIEEEEITENDIAYYSQQNEVYEEVEEQEQEEEEEYIDEEEEQEDEDEEEDSLDISDSKLTLEERKEKKRKQQVNFGVLMNKYGNHPF